MSIDSKLVVMTSNKNPFEIIHKVENALESIIKSIHKEKRIKPRIQFQIHTYGMITASFDTKENSQRQLNIHFTCDNDQDHVPELIGPKLIFSIGCWGLNELIMNTLAEHLVSEGKVFVQYNDCSDSFIELSSKDLLEMSQLKDQAQELETKL